MDAALDGGCGTGGLGFAHDPGGDKPENFRENEKRAREPGPHARAFGSVRNYGA